MTPPDFASVLDQDVAAARRVGGGCINEGWRVDLASGERLFVKTRPEVAPGEYAAEADGLRWLGDPGAVRVPEVHAVADDMLALEWIDEGSLDAAGAEDLGRGLAALHAAGADGFGWHAPIRFGRLEISNDPAGSTWAEFYAERRLRPLARQARDEGSLSRAGADAVEAVCQRVDRLAGPPEPPARLHGDLWGGNVLWGADGEAWLVDPAAHGGHRETDLAMLQLFGAAGQYRVLAAYEEVAPLAAGWRTRVALHQIHPLLVHAVLFGGPYLASALSAAREYL